MPTRQRRGRSPCLTNSPSLPLLRAVLVPMPRPLRTAAGNVPAAPLVPIDVHTSEGIVGVFSRMTLAPNRRWNVTRFRRRLLLHDGIDWISIQARLAAAEALWDMTPLQADRCHCFHRQVP